MEKVLRAISIGIVIFAMVIAFVVSTRIDQNTIAVLSGTIIGILFATPCAIIVTYLVARRRDSGNTVNYERQYRQSAPLPQNPPQYWVVPQTYPPMLNQGYNQRVLNAGMAGWQTSPDGLAALPPPRRRFYVIGESGEPRLVDERLSPSDDTRDAYAMEDNETGAAF